jgi:hypothetical protein
MENQPQNEQALRIEGIKPLAMSAMKRDGLPAEGEKIEGEKPVKIEGQQENTAKIK